MDRQHVKPPLLSWYGGKTGMAEWIVSLMPPRCRTPNNPNEEDPGWLHYVEPYAGGLAVLLANDPDGISEVVNDKNGRLTQFWSVLQDEEQFAQFMRRVRATPFSEQEWKVAGSGVKAIEFLEPWEGAANFFIHCRQSLAGRMKGFTGITKARTRRGMNNEVSAWLSAVDGLPAVHERLKRVLIVGPDDALNVIRKHDGPRTLFYLDPPYVPESRTAREVYRHEMTIEQHEELLRTLAKIKGRFLLSGYGNDLYHDFAQTHDWSCDSIEIDNKASGKKVKDKEQECIWCNFCPSFQP